jgi:hypothetical protein
MMCILYTNLFIYIVRELIINTFTNELVLFKKPIKSRDLEKLFKIYKNLLNLKNTLSDN